MPPLQVSSPGSLVKWYSLVKSETASPQRGSLYCYAHAKIYNRTCFRRNQGDNLQKPNDTTRIVLSIMHREIFQLEQGTGSHESLLLLFVTYLKWRLGTNRTRGDGLN